MSQVLDYLRAKLDAFAFDRASSRPLAVVRIMLALDLIYEFASPWVAHRVDDKPEILILTLIIFTANWFVLVGLETRWAVAALWLSFGVLHIYYGRVEWVGNYQQPVQVFQVITLLLIGPSGRSLSVDRVLEVRRARREGREPEPELMPYWIYDLFALEIAAIYFWAGRDKTDAAWFRGERMEHYWMNWYGGSDSLQRSPWIHPISVVMAWVTTIVELALALGLVFRKTRVYVVWMGFLLHIGILYYFAVTYFSMMMMTVLFACLPPRWFHEVVNMLGYEPPAAPAEPKPEPEPEPD